MPRQVSKKKLELKYEKPARVGRKQGAFTKEETLSYISVTSFSYCYLLIFTLTSLHLN